MTKAKKANDKFRKAELDVIEILKANKLARKSDQALFIMYWIKKANKIPFKFFFLCPSLYGGCSFKTIERCRRKVQEHYPKLKDKETAEKRMEAEMDYEQYALNM